MAQYCTIQQVKEVWRLASQDFREFDPQIDSEISTAIDESTSVANDILQSRYSIATIESSIPQDVNSFTKTMAAILVGTRFSTTSSIEANMILSKLRKQAEMYKGFLKSGSLRNASGVLISVAAQEQFTPFATKLVV